MRKGTIAFGLLTTGLAGAALLRERRPAPRFMTDVPAAAVDLPPVAVAVPPAAAVDTTPKRRTGRFDGTRNALYEEAKRLDIPGRSRMTKDELAAALAEHGVEI